MIRFATRAILAATRSPEVNQIPSAIPIYQAAAFSAANSSSVAAASRSSSWSSI